MRLVVDLQSAQASNGARGIGRYSLDLAKAMAAQSRGHEIWLALNSRFVESIEGLRAEFDGLIPQDQIRVFEIPDVLDETGWGHPARVRAAELLRETFLADLQPDIIHVSSLFEGIADHAVTSIGALGKTVPTAVTLYDLIPLIDPKAHLSHPQVREHYFRKLQYLKKADLLLAISESSRRDALDYLHMPSSQVANISAAANKMFQPGASDGADPTGLLSSYGITKPFVLCVSGHGPNKNIEGLIEAYALLPAEIRGAHQLVVVCALDPSVMKQFEQLGTKVGLKPRDLVFTGFVPDHELLSLYRSCHLFVTPSFREGFGLPALEAMSCGAPVVASNTSSLPEVVGYPDALFDPFNTKAMTAKLAEALSQEKFRVFLREHGLEQARQFSWERCAEQAWNALEVLAGRIEQGRRSERPVSTARRPRLAYVSPLPPEPTGIADYSADLLPELSKYYEITAITPQEKFVRNGMADEISVQNLEWFMANAHGFDRIIYHFGNSPFHAHMRGLLRKHPGIVVLHDFFLGDLSSPWEKTDEQPETYSSYLYRSHGYEALLRYEVEGLSSSIRQYPTNLDIIRCAAGVIVHSRYSIEAAKTWYGSPGNHFKFVPMLRALPRCSNRSAVRKRLGVAEGGFLVCTFGHLAARKGVEELLAGWQLSPLAQERKCRLIFVGGGDSQYLEGLKAKIKSIPCSENIQVTGFVEAAVYEDYLAAANVAVQLRLESRGESSKTAMDCLAHGIPTIVNAHATLAELPDEVVLKLPDAFTQQELIEAITSLWHHPELLHRLGEAGRKYVQDFSDPRLIGERYYQAIEDLFRNSSFSRGQCLIRELADLRLAEESAAEIDWLVTAEAIQANRPRLGARQLLLDVSDISGHDARTGIQRVVRAVFWELATAPPEGFRVEPIRYENGHYRYARKFAMGQLVCSGSIEDDDPVEVAPGDIFFGLDWVMEDMPKRKKIFQSWRNQGVRIYFEVYDLLPVLQPQFFVPALPPTFEVWLEMLLEMADGLICISQTVADDLIDWSKRHPVPRSRPCRIGWVHQGADLQASIPTRGVPPEAKEIYAALALRPTFLMVAKLEPRKGHAQALAACELLWSRGIDCNLLLVGQIGWHTEALAKKIERHPESHRRLFWLQNVSDEFLDQLYSRSSALLAASENEGFGLPLIEAAKYGLSILARDTPVFREVAGDFAYYFKGETPESLATAMANWLKLYRKGAAPASGDLPWITWKESVQRLLTALQVDDAARISLSGKSEAAKGHSHSGQVFCPPSRLTNFELSAKLAQQRARQRQPPEENVAYGIDGPINFLDYLREGWSQPEEWGIWSEGPTVQMCFYIQPAQKTTHALFLEGRAFVVPVKHPSLTVKVLLNGQPAGTRTFTPAAQLGCLEISLCQADPDGCCRIQLQIETPRSPSELGLSPDVRKVGFGLEKMRLCRIKTSDS